MPWASEVEVCNGALRLIGAESIFALTDTTKEGQLCAQFYANTRDFVLRDYPWNFATRRALLNTPLAEGDPDYPVADGDWTYGFTLPVTPYYCLRVLSTAGNEPYRVEGRTLYANVSSLYIKYTQRLTAVSAWDSQALLALCALLAAHLAQPITQSLSMMQNMRALYQDLYIRAQDTDSQEGTPDELDSDELVNIRY